MSRPAPITVACRRFRLSFNGYPRVLYAGLCITVFWFVLALGADVISPYDPNAQDISNVLDPPSMTHWFGTDNFGRDVLSRVIHGTRVDLQIGLIGVILPFFPRYHDRGLVRLFRQIDRHSSHARPGCHAVLSLAGIAHCDHYRFEARVSTAFISPSRW